jgi:hypothetical protein
MSYEDQQDGAINKDHSPNCLVRSEHWLQTSAVATDLRQRFIAIGSALRRLEAEASGWVSASRHLEAKYWMDPTSVFFIAVVNTSGKESD